MIMKKDEFLLEYIAEIYCSCGELMDEVVEEYDENCIVFDCPECGRRRFFNAHTKEDITKDFIMEND